MRRWGRAAAGAQEQQKLSTQWEELTAPDFVTAIHRSQGVCLLPFGILEKHGPHMPIGTGLINVRWVALHAAAEEYAAAERVLRRGAASAGHKAMS